MIEKISLRNFQAHRKLDLELGKFTVFHGGSNSAKSSVLRAIAALVRNDSVSDYITLGQKDLSVKLFLSDGHEITWEKGGPKNDYLLKRSDGTESQFKKVGSAVPDEISEVLRIGPITLESGEKAHPNVHEQSDSPFLAFDTAPYVAKVFGELTSAGKLFTAANEGNRRLSADKKLRTIREQDSSTTQNELQDFAKLDTVESYLVQAKELITKCENTEIGLSELQNLMSSLTSTESGLTSESAQIARFQLVSTLPLEKIEQLSSVTQDLSSLMSSLSQVGSSLQELEREERALHPIAKLDLSEIESLTSEAEALDRVEGELREVETSLVVLGRDIARLEAVEKLDAEFFSKLERISVTLTTLGELRAGLALKDEELVAADTTVALCTNQLNSATALWDQLDVCTTCGQELTEETKAHLHG